MKVTENIKIIKKYIKHATTVFIMAHKSLDLDAIGSCIGMYHLLTKLNKECYIIIDDKTHEIGVSKVLHEVEGCYNIIHSSDIENTLNPKSKRNLLVILDTNKKELLQNKECLKYFSQKIVLDHHELGKTSVKDGLIICDTELSSTCEIIVKISEHYKLEFTPYVATLLLSGIVLDTNNFMLNTSEETFYTAYYLTVLGASPKKVQYLLKQDLNDYIEQQKLLTNIEIIDQKYAIAKGTPYAFYRREDLARIADILIFFNNIEMAFVIGKVSKTEVAVSARSIGNYSIETVMNKLGGGGNDCNGATIITNKNISEIIDKIKTILKEETN